MKMLVSEIKDFFFIYLILIKIYLNIALIILIKIYLIEVKFLYYF